MRDLVDALPVLVGPGWLDNPAQPIGVDDVVASLVAALNGSVVYEVARRRGAACRAHAGTRGPATSAVVTRAC